MIRRNYDFDYLDKDMYSSNPNLNQNALVWREMS